MKRIAQVLLHLLIVVPVTALAVLVEVNGESIGPLRHILLPLVATGICLQQPAGVIASVFIGIGLAGEACGSLPFGASAVASAMSGLVCLNVLRQTRIPWIWRGVLNVFCVCGLQSLIGGVATAIRSSGEEPVFSVFSQAMQVAAIGGLVWLLLAIGIAGAMTAFSYPVSRRAEVELR